MPYLAVATGTSLNSNHDTLTHRAYRKAATIALAEAALPGLIAHIEGRCQTSPATSIEPHKDKKVRRCVPNTNKSDDQWEHVAVNYARWLAARDGIAVPNRELRVEWSGVYNEFKKRKQPYRNGLSATYERRIQAVTWGYKKPIYSERKAGRQGAWIDEWVIELRIELPHWDFVPAPPTEELLS